MPASPLPLHLHLQEMHRQAEAQQAAHQQAWTLALGEQAAAAAAQQAEHAAAVTDC